MRVASIPLLLLTGLALPGCAPEQGVFAATFISGVPSAAGKYGMMCKAYQRSVPFEAFEGAVEHDAYLAGSPAVQLIGREGSDPTATFTGVLSTRTGRYDIRIYEGVEDGRMCITGLTIGGTPMLPSPAESPPGRPAAPWAISAAREP
jgi:hypothetical protein